MRSLYISHQGLLEGLGHSQVLGYLKGLARRGVAIDLFTYELATAEESAIAEVQATLTGTGIRWTPLRRARDTRLIVKVKESTRGVLEAFGSALARRPDIVHGRSYLPTAVSDVVATLVPRAKLVFDCRGMLADEFVDASHWTKDRLEYKLVKRYEARAFRRAEGVVVLTKRLQRWVEEQGWFGPTTHVEAIPCCVDLEGFAVDEEERTRLRRELGFEDALVVAYVGSLSSWYRDDDLARFAGIVRAKASALAKPKPVRFLVLTPSPSEKLVEMARAKGFAADEIVVRKVKPTEVPRWLSAGDIGLSFIKATPSKIGSSPTKVAEYLACGLPVVLNGDIGDQAELADEPDACVVLSSFEDEALEDAAARALVLADVPFTERLRRTRKVADERFGLERIGVARYLRLYENVTNGKRGSRPKTEAAPRSREESLRSVQ